MRLTEKLSVAALVTVLTKFLLAGMTIKLGSSSFQMGGVDGMAIAAILTPCLGAPHLESWVGGIKNDNKV